MDSRAERRLGLPVLLILFSVLYFLAAKLGIATSLPPEGVVIVWPPNAIVLAVLLAVDRKNWWLFFVATVATEIVADMSDYPLWAAAGYGIVNFSEAALAAVLLSRWAGVPPLSGVGDFARYLAIGPILASGSAALFGAAIYKVGAPELDYLHYWRVFWFGDALGLLVVGTALLLFQRPPRWWKRAGLETAAEGVVLSAGLAAALAWAFFTVPEVPRVYVVFPFLLWAAVRFGVHGASVAVMATIGVAIASAAGGRGPFANLSSIDVVIALQGLALIVAVSTFFLAFTIEDFWRAQDGLLEEADERKATAAKLEVVNRELETTNRGLDETVEERTRRLRETLARNEILLKEVHHRVKNNLQMISGLITLQGRTGTAGELSEKIIKQISAIATTYDTIHRMENVDKVDLWLVASELCATISDSVSGTVAVTCETSGEAAVQPETAVAFALAFNELVTNSIKHAGPHRGKPAVQVRCHRSADQLIVRITDTGPGFPAGFDFRKVEGFGLRMAHSVVARAGGAIEVGGENDRSTVEVRLPALLS